MNELKDYVYQNIEKTKDAYTHSKLILIIKFCLACGFAMRCILALPMFTMCRDIRDIIGLILGIAVYAAIAYLFAKSIIKQLKNIKEE